MCLNIINCYRTATACMNKNTTFNGLNNKNTTICGVAIATLTFLAARHWCMGCSHVFCVLWIPQCLECRVLWISPLNVLRSFMYMIRNIFWYIVIEESKTVITGTSYLQNIPKHMRTVCVLMCFRVDMYWLVLTYMSALFHCLQSFMIARIVKQS